MAMNNYISLMLVCLFVVSPMAKAQLGLGGLLGGGGLGGLGGLLGGGGNGGLLGGLLNIPSIQGVLFCSLNGNLSPNNVTSTPAFANAGINLQCGRTNTVVSSTTTNAAGMFTLPTNAIQMLLSTLLSDCRLVVVTPLASCNASLPSLGNLASNLSFLGSTVNGLLNVISLGPAGFILMN